MTDPNAPRAADLEARIQELEAKMQRVPLFPGGESAHTNCESKGCTNCKVDGLADIVLPGESTPISGAEILTRLRGATNR